MTSRFLKDLKKLGYPYWRVEHWNSFTKRRIDLFGLFDYVCIVPGKYIVGLQFTTKNNLHSHRKKMRASPYLDQWLSTKNKAYLWYGEKGKRGLTFEEFL